MEIQEQLEHLGHLLFLDVIYMLGVAVAVLGD
jgi:hypothetical protein